MQTFSSFYISSRSFVKAPSLWKLSFLWTCPSINLLHAELPPYGLLMLAFICFLFLFLLILSAGGKGLHLLFTSLLSGILSLSWLLAITDPAPFFTISRVETIGAFLVDHNYFESICSISSHLIMSQNILIRWGSVLAEFWQSVWIQTCSILYLPIYIALFL